MLWDSQFVPHFYQIFHGLILPLYRMMYNEDPPRCSPEAQIDIIPIARWFGEEWFTYIRVFGSTVPPHVLPLYIPDKLLAREIAYQTCSEGGLTKYLKDKKTAAMQASILIDCVNENLHRANLIAETTPGYLPNKLQLEA